MLSAKKKLEPNILKKSHFFLDNQNENISVKFSLFTNILIPKKQKKKNFLLQDSYFFPIWTELSFSNEQFSQMAKIKTGYWLLAIIFKMLPHDIEN